MTDPRYAQPQNLGGHGALIDDAPDKTMVVVTYALYAAGFLSAGLLTLVGLVIAYVQRPNATPLARTHYTFLIRTFWLGLLWAGIVALIMLVGVVFTVTIIGMVIGIPLLILGKIIGLVALIWYGARVVLGLLAAIGDRPYGAPRSLWI